MKSLSGFGLLASVFLSITALFVRQSSSETSAPIGTERTTEPAVRPIVRLLAVGDVNLGRDVGQEILRGNVLFPFEFVADSFRRYDIVFANLESTLSDQNGETRHPRNTLLFTGPPGGAMALREAGVTVVSTANNHALDYGMRSHRETIANLTAAGVAFAGTSNDSSRLWEPAIIERNGIRFAFFACTDIMNIENPVWKKYVASADTSRLLPRIRAYRDSVDFVLVSYHGGEEYADRPTKRTIRFAQAVIRGGADLFIGHHPHVPYGIDVADGKYVVYSLGNFVFRQNEPFWAQRSFAFAVDIGKDSTGTRVLSFACLPVEAGDQPRFIEKATHRGEILERIKKLSSTSIASQLRL